MTEIPFFKSGDYWQGMFWIKRLRKLTESIGIDVYGGDNKPVIDGYGYQASILIFNDQNIEINSLEITNSFSHIDQNISTISAQTPNLFANEAYRFMDKCLHILYYG